MSCQSHATALTAVVKRARKQHAKSRAGCQMCKARKIKCDETKLQCSNCIRFGIPCDFLPLSARKEETSSSAARCRDGKRRRGRPRGDWSRFASKVRAEAPTAAAPQTWSLLGLSVDHLELLHHYTTVTATTIGDPRVWRDEAPKLGREHPCIFHAMLSISGHHMARLCPANSARYLALAERHYEAAARDATQMLPRLDVDNCQALYIVTVLICFTAFARGPSPGDMLLVTQEGAVPWISLLRGVRLVLETIGSPVVLSGILDPPAQPEPTQEACTGRLKSDTSPSPPVERCQSPFGIWNWRQSLENVGAMANMTPVPAEADMYAREIKSLARCFEAIFGAAGGSAKCKYGQVHVVMAWVYTLDADFLTKLMEKDGIAFMLLGHFAMLVDTLDTYWFIEGWGTHILREVKGALGESWNDLLALRSVGNDVHTTP